MKLVVDKRRTDRRLEAPGALHVHALAPRHAPGRHTGRVRGVATRERIGGGETLVRDLRGARHAAGQVELLLPRRRLQQPRAVVKAVRVGGKDPDAKRSKDEPYDSLLQVDVRQDFACHPQERQENLLDRAEIPELDEDE